jgi:hypothetical protein
MKRPPSDKAPSLVSVYSGRELRGYILNRGVLGFESFDAAERSLGIFPDMQAAADAVSAEASQ